MNKLRLCIVSSVLAMATAGQGVAHHSYAMFDSSKVVALEATVSEYQWTNPHIWLHLEVPGAGGAKSWEIEGNSLLRMRQMGMTKDSLKKGDKATVRIHPARDGSSTGSLISIAMNGKVLMEDNTLRPVPTITRKKPQ